MKVRLGTILKEFKAKPPIGSSPEVLTLTERNGFVRQSDRFNKRLATEDVSGYKYIELEDIAFNPYLLWAGAIARNGRFASGVISPLYPTFRVTPGNDARYVERLLLSQHLISAYDTIAFGSVPRRRRSSVKDFLNLEVSELPPLDEQRRIATILDKADELRTKRREARAHLDTLTQSIFHSMFGEGRQNPLAWPTSELGRLLEFGPQNGMYLPASEYGAGVPIVRIDSFRGGVMDDLSSLKRLRASPNDLENYGLQTGDILINRVNSIEHLGKSTVVPDLREPTVFESNMMRCRFDSKKVHTEYLRSALMSDYMYGQIVRRAKRAVNQASINQTDVRQLEIRVPPLELQQSFATRVAAVERLKETNRQHLAELDALFASLQHRAFKGKL